MTSPTTKRLIFTALAFTLMFAGLTGGTGGCGSSGSGAPASSTDLKGTVALNNGEVGTLTVTIQSEVASAFSFSFLREALAQTSGTVTATGECITPSATIALSGTYNPATGDLALASGDGDTVFEGTSGTGSGGMSGTISDADGNPLGGFSGVFTTPGDETVSYCGIAFGGQEDAFNVNIAANGDLTGTAQPIPPSTDRFINLKGSFDKTTNTFTACSDDPEGATPVCGEVKTDGTVIGRFQSHEGGEGCFVGDASVCVSGTLPPVCTTPTAVCTYPTCP